MFNSWKISLCCIIVMVTPITAASLTLPEVVAHGISHVPDTRLKVAQLNATAATIKQAKAGYLPDLNVTGGYGREHAENPVAASVDGSKESTLNRSEFGVDLTENVFDGFNTKYELIRTKNETLALKYEVLGETNNISLDITEQFLNVLLQQRLLIIAKNNVDEHIKIAEMIAARKKAGLSRESEYTQAKSRIALAQSNVISQQALLDDAKTRFERFVKLKAENLVMPSIPKYPVIPKEKEQALNIAYLNHPILKSAKADMKAADAQHESSKFTNYPKIDFVLEADRNRNIDGITGQNNNYIAMMRASYNLYKGGYYFAKQQESAFQLVEAKEIKNRTILQIKEAINLAWTAVESQTKRLQFLDQYKSNALKSHEVYKEEFKLNKRSLLDVLDSQSEVFQSSLELEQAKFDEIFARYRLLNAMGLLNDFLNVKVDISKRNHNSIISSDEYYIQSTHIKGS